MPRETATTTEQLRVAVTALCGSIVMCPTPS
jgi:hypothetical protein